MLPEFKKQYSPYTDRDSFVYAIFCHDIYQFMKCNPYLLDTYNYPKDHPLYSIINQNLPGIFKDEADIIISFVHHMQKLNLFSALLVFFLISMKCKWPTDLLLK